MYFLRDYFASRSLFAPDNGKKQPVTGSKQTTFVYSFTKSLTITDKNVILYIQEHIIALQFVQTVHI